jgi:hypothetical protein
VSLDRPADDLGVLPREPAGGLVSVLLREGRVSADVGEQEGANVGIGAPVDGRSLRVTGHAR